MTLTKPQETGGFVGNFYSSGEVTSRTRLNPMAAFQYDPVVFLRAFRRAAIVGIVYFRMLLVDFHISHGNQSST